MNNAKEINGVMLITNFFGILFEKEKTSTFFGAPSVN